MVKLNILEKKKKKNLTPRGNKQLQKPNFISLAILQKLCGVIKASESAKFKF